MKPYSAYLDTNILILGSKKEEHEKIKEKANKGEIELYKSNLNDIEQHGKVFPKRRAKDFALRLYDKLGPEMIGNDKLHSAILNYVNKRDGEYQQTVEGEKKEKSFWSDVKILPISLRSEFARLFYICGIMPSHCSFIKKDLILLNKLISRYGIKERDAVHLINAHSGGIDYFLTWDEKTIIKKIKNINWLRFKALTPRAFLKYER
jgi:predicted nucleic acid-binding protein